MKKLWALLLPCIAVGCSTSDGLRFERVEAYQMTDIEQSSYAEYRKAIRERLEKNWRELIASPDDLPAPSIVPGVDDYAIDTLVELHAPTDSSHETLCRFEDGKPRGMLLIHGLYDSPYTMHDLEEFFRARCFFTRSILLPGHGTRPGSLLKIETEHWIKAVEFAVAELADEVDNNVYLAGFSTGGALALNSALDGVPVKGIFLFAPALRVEAEAAYRARKLGLEWVPLHRLVDRDAIKYESIALDSVIAVDRLAQRVRSRLESVGMDLDIPVFIAVAQSDYTIKSKTAMDYYRQGRFGKSAEMFVYAPIRENGDCIKTVREGDARTNTPTYIGSCFLHRQGGRQFMIADYSHMALTLRPDDPHYGLQGGYRYCLQYFLDADKRRRCEDATLEYPDVCFGERSVSGSQKYPQCRGEETVVRRLTSNPQFEELTGLMDAFIQKRILFD